MQALPSAVTEADRARDNQERGRNNQRIFNWRTCQTVTPRKITSSTSTIWKGHMTRNFKQSRRDDERPNSRRYSGRYEGEQSPRPARPRLNRASVDRAWESGAPQRHHDYRARGTNDTRSTQPRQQGQPYRANRGQYSPNDSPSAPNGRNYRKPSFQRQENR